MRKVLHANDDNLTLSGAFIIAWRVDKYLRDIGISYDYISMDDFDNSPDAKFAIPKDAKTFGAKLRENRFIGLLKLPFYVYKVLKKNEYSVIHIDCDYTYKALLYAIPAKILGVKTVVHSHTTGLAGDYQKLKLFAHILSKKALSLFTDCYIGCSKEAAEWLTPKKRINEKTVVFNGIDLSSFKYDKREREEWRNKLEINNRFVIGNMGSLCYRKNQTFLIDILKDVKKYNDKAILLLVGPGVEEYIDEMKKKVNDYNLNDSVIFYGMTTNTRELLNCMDLFAFPSFVEGAPLALYEAEAVGVSCIMSNTISTDAVICDWVSVKEINNGIKPWVDEITLLMSSEDTLHTRKIDEKYGLKKMAERLKEIYLSF
jgi:glycosyltransferase involved in cell wall biosynthesis